jgi:hypothetical protein
MPNHNPKHHTIKGDKIIFHSNHLGDVIEVGIDKIKCRFYGIREDGTKVEDTKHYGNKVAQRVMLYKIFYEFEGDNQDTWTVGYRLKDKNENIWKSGFKTAREAWLYREALISANVADK